MGWRWLVLLGVVGCGEALPLPSAEIPDAALSSAPVDAAPEPPPGVFDLDRLHMITIEVDVAHLATLNDERNLQRVPARVSYDGVVLPDTGIRRKGFIGSRRDLFDKTGFNIDFHEFVPAQRLHGLKKLTLNNGVQDNSLLHEHLAYEIFRRAGLPAPLTAHAHVTLNGIPFGLYVVKESIDGQFLDRNFGVENDHGNLYEGPCCRDFVAYPEHIELKDEAREMRSRDDVVELTQLIRDTPDPEWEAVVGARLDLDNVIATYALEAVTDHFDDYFYNGNNYYLYHHPGTGKFVMLPHGMDQALWWLGDPWRRPQGLLGIRIRSLPALDARFRHAVKRVMTQAYDLPALATRLDRAATVLLGQPPTDARTAADVQRVRGSLFSLREMLVRRLVWAAGISSP
jgi:spore coat protein H